MTTDALDKAQLSELEQFREAAVLDFRKNSPTLEYTIAGTGLSDGGLQKIAEMMETHFQNMLLSAEKMPNELEVFPSPERLRTLVDIMSSIETTASFYLFMDHFRPRGAWSLSSKKREATAEYNRIMDQRAWAAVSCLKSARSYLPMVERAGGRV